MNNLLVFSDPPSIDGDMLSCMVNVKVDVGAMKKSAPDILPPGCIFVYRQGDARFFVIQTTPRQYAFQMQGEGETEPDDDDNVDVYDIYLPWLQWYVYIAGSELRIGISWSREAVSDFSMPVSLPPFPNIYADAEQFCTGFALSDLDVPDGVGPGTLAVAAVERLLGSRWNRDIMPDWEAFGVRIARPPSKVLVTEVQQAVDAIYALGDKDGNVILLGSSRSKRRTAVLEAVRNYAACLPKIARQSYITGLQAWENLVAENPFWTPTSVSRQSFWNKICHFWRKSAGTALNLTVPKGA